jgi:tryptophan synthase alpha chain
VTGCERIEAAFEARSGKAALMPYLMGCYPDAQTSVRIGLACVDAGADLLELGVPYSDPLADGPVIHAAATEALNRGATLDAVIEVGRQLSGRVAVVLMCYANLIHNRGWDAFAESLAEAGICGVIVPDLPLEEAPDALAALDARGLALVPLVAPTTPDDRLTQIGSRARGFLYTVSVAGTTGERDGIAAGVSGVVARAQRATSVPVAVGFGISTPEQARGTAEAGAEGVIIGSRLVRAAGESDDPAAAVGELVAGFAGALR